MLEIRDGPCNNAGWRFGDQTEKIHKTLAWRQHKKSTKIRRNGKRAFKQIAFKQFLPGNSPRPEDNQVASGICWWYAWPGMQWDPYFRSKSPVDGTVSSQAATRKSWICTVYFLSLVSKPPASGIAWTISDSKHKGKTLKERYSYCVSRQGYCMGHIRFQA